MRDLKIVILLVLFAFNECKANKASVSEVIAQKTIEWNNANSRADIEGLRPLYAVNITGYGVVCSRYDFLRKKRGFFNKIKEYQQSIVSNFTITEYESGLYKCEFEKRANSAKPPHGIKTFKSYLVFENKHDGYKIIEEGDEITNYNINYHPNYGKEKNVVVVAASIQTKTNWPGIIKIVGILLVMAGVGIYILRLEKGAKSKKKIKAIPTVQPATKNEVANKEKDTSEENKKKGLAFEEFIVQCFNKDFYQFIEWQGDKFVNGRYALNSLNPDLVIRFQYKGAQYHFAVECKYRTLIGINRNIEVCEPRQLDNYKKFGQEREMPVFMALGFGGVPSRPQELYIIPIKKLKTTKIGFHELRNYKKKPGELFYYDTEAKSLT